MDLLTLPIGEEKSIPGVRILRVGNPFGVKNIPIGSSRPKAFFDILLSPRGAGLDTPLKLLDYLKAGHAIVAADTPANRRILDDSVAVLVEPRVALFAEAISRLIGDEDIREQMGERGRRLIAELYNFEEFKRRLGACYEEVTSCSRRT